MKPYPDFEAHVHAIAKRRILNWIVNQLFTLVVIVCLIAALLLLTGCTSGPVVTNDKLWMGGSALTKNKGYYAKYKGHLGTVEVGTAENDETIIPGKIGNYYGIKAAIDGATASQRTKESTTRILAKEETSRLGIKTAGANEALRIKTVVPEPAAVIPAATVPPAVRPIPGTGLN